MRRLVLAAVLLMGLMGPLPGLAHAEDGDIPTLIDTVFRPAAAAYHDALEPLARSIREDCPDPAKRERIVRAFAGAVSAWGRLQPLLQGPLGDAVLASRISFWPDKHGTAGRQLAAALAAPRANA